MVPVANSTCNPKIRPVVVLVSLRRNTIAVMLKVEEAIIKPRMISRPTSSSCAFCRTIFEEVWDISSQVDPRKQNIPVSQMHKIRAENCNSVGKKKLVIVANTIEINNRGRVPRYFRDIDRLGGLELDDFSSLFGGI